MLAAAAAVMPTTIMGMPAERSSEQRWTQPLLPCPKSNTERNRETERKRLKDKRQRLKDKERHRNRGTKRLIEADSNRGTEGETETGRWRESQRHRQSL